MIPRDHAAGETGSDGTPSYILRGGDAGAARLRILGAATRATTLRLLERAEVTAGQRVLDAGCGSGEVTAELARIVGPDGHVTALDADAVVLEHARVRVHGVRERVTLVRADVAQP